MWSNSLCSCCYYFLLLGFLFFAVVGGVVFVVVGGRRGIMYKFVNNQKKRYFVPGLDTVCLG